MHVINRPNLRGLECDLKQHFIEFPNPYGNPPNHPNFRLGPLDGSPCDTLGIDNHPLADFRPDPTDTNSLAIHFWDVSSYEPAQWLWDFGDPASGAANMSQDTSPVHLFSAPGFYTVCLTVANSYSAGSKCKVVEVKTSDNSSPQGAEEEAILFPNPTTDWVQWKGLSAGETVTVRVHDTLGRLCFEEKTSQAAVDLGALPDGLYLVTLIGKGGHRITAKAVVLAKKY